MSAGQALATWEAQAELDGIFGDVAQMESRDAHVRWIVTFATRMTELGIRTKPATLVRLGATLIPTHGHLDPQQVAQQGFVMRRQLHPHQTPRLAKYE